MPQSRVSVVVAVKNGEAFLAEALASVQGQTRPPAEIIVVDGHSTDRSRSIAEAEPDVRVLLQNGNGFAGAWNEGIRAANGDFIAILDSDDRWTPTKLEVQVAALEDNPDCGYAIGHTRFFRMAGAPLPPGFERVDLETDHAAPFPSVMLVRRSVFDEYGLFEEHWEVSSDVEWFRRIDDRGVTGILLPEVLLERRIHAANLSYHPPDPGAFNREILSLLKASLDRRRRRANEKERP